MENLGLDPPMGSTSVTHCKSNNTNRNVGMGDPWAGQDRLRLSDWAWEDPIIVSVLMENLGFDPPMGSKKQIFIVAIYTVLDMDTP